MAIRIAVVVPNWNGSTWLPGCLDSIAHQTRPAGQTIVVDNGSTDGSLELLRAAEPPVEVIELGRNTGFAYAANRGIEAADADAVALVNTDVVLEPDWLERMGAALEADPRAAAVASKMVDLSDPKLLYDTGDMLRRDGACVQRGRFERDDGRFDEPGEVFGACAGAALYRRSAVLDLGGFDERFFAYIEDVDLALRLRLAGWRCRYEPALARHASEGSSGGLARGPAYWIERNTLLLVAKAFPARWLPQVAYRQLGAARQALRERKLRAHLRGAAAAVRLLPTMLRERRRLRRGAAVRIEAAVPPHPLRGPAGEPLPEDGGVPALFVSYAGVFGGSERILLDLAPALGDDVWLACPEGELAERARRQGLRVVPLTERPLDLRATPRDRLAGPGRLAAHGREVRRLVEALRPQLVVAWGMRSAIACATLARPADAAGRIVFQHVDLLPGPAIGRLVRAASARADRVVALSRAAARDLDPDGSLGSRLEVIHPGVDPERFRAGTPPDGRMELLLLGAIVDWKRPDLALEAVALAARELPELTLTVAGAPFNDAGRALLARLEARAAEPDLAGRVSFAGRVSDPRPLLERAASLLHCSDAEPFGLVLLEAFACGRPVVGPRAGGPAEVVDARVGRLYEPGDAASAAAALVEVVGTPGLAAELGAEARRRAEGEHSLERARERWRAAVTPRRPPAARTGDNLALVTVTHNSGADLTRLLDSVAHHLPRAEVVVVDAGSDDDGPQLARRWPGGATVIELDNVGFGRGSNRGVEAVSRPVTALVNPDVELVDGSLELLAAEAARRDRPERILAPLVVYPDGSRQDSVHPEPASAADMVHALVPSALLPRAAAARLDRWRSNRPQRVGWAVGCCLVARTDTFRGLGPFDEEIFLYGEDMELCLRAREQGVETWFWPSARVVHRRAHSTEARFGGEPLELLARRRHEAIARRRGRRRARIDDLVQLITYADRFALKKLASRPADRERRQLATYARLTREPPGS